MSAVAQVVNAWYVAVSPTSRATLPCVTGTDCTAEVGDCMLMVVSRTRRSLTMLKWSVGTYHPQGSRSWLQVYYNREDILTSMLPVYKRLLEEGACVGGLTVLNAQQAMQDSLVRYGTVRERPHVSQRKIACDGLSKEQTQKKKV